MRISLGQAAEVRLGRQRAPQFEVGEHQVPYLRSANVIDGELDLSDVKAMEFTPAEQVIFRLEPGDVLVTEGSGSRDTVGVSAVWQAEIAGMVCFQNTLLRLRPRAGITDGRFLAWWIRSARLSGQIAAVSSGAHILHIGSDGLKRLTLALPSVEEQRRIADFLDDRVARIDKILAARREQAERSELALKARLQEVLTFDGMTILGEPPWFEHRSCRLVKLGQVWEVIDCKHRTPIYVPAGYPVVSPGDVSPGRLDTSVATRFVDEADYADLADGPRRCRVGDIVYSRNASAGIAAYVETSAPFTMGQDVCRITSRDQDQLYLTYVLNWLVEAQLEAARVGATFTRINVARIKALTVPLPNVEVQREIASRCDALAEAHRRVETGISRSVTLLQEYKQSLITAAVTGELDVTTASTRIPE